MSQKNSSSEEKGTQAAAAGDASTDASVLKVGGQQTPQPGCGEESAQDSAPACGPADLEEGLEAILALVAEATGHDFSSYKTNTVLRRIERRMVLKNADGLATYVALLQDDPQEAQALCQEILIGVTSFFRDPEAFEAVRTLVLPRLFAGRSPDDPLRIWHACCATGEEVYSMAMLVREYLDQQGQEAAVQLFATDLDDAALAQARAGIYEDEVVAGLGEERLAAFFTRSGQKWQVKKSLREMVVFAHHSLIKDPPFSKIDLLVCRNFLIYLTPEMQKRLLSLFHRVLKPAGFLFLGTAESVGPHSQLFTTIDKKWKIFGRSEAAPAKESFFPAAIGFRSPRAQAVPQSGGGQPSAVEVAEKVILERFAPPCVVVNDKYEVVHVFSRTGGYLEVPPGEPTRDILKLAREALRPPLRAAIYKCLTDGQEVVFRGGKSGEEPPVKVRVQPLQAHPSPGKLLLVVFEPAAQPDAFTLPAVGEPVSAGEGQETLLVAQLEEQLRITQEELQATAEQLSTCNEGFLATSEELTSINEEYQAANEELQSTNEELVTVNAELHAKVEELNLATNNMENLLASSQIATIFLDRDLNLKGVTPAAAAIFNLLPADVGRPFKHFAGKIDWPNFRHDAESVLAGEPFAEREVSSLDKGHCYLKRLYPYRDQDGSIDGIVVILIDISERKRADAEILASKAKLEAALESMTDAVFISDVEGRFVDFNEAFATFHKFRNKEQCAKTFAEYPEILDVFLPGGELAPVEQWAVPRALRGETATNAEYTLRRKDTGETWVGSYSFAPIRDTDGTIIGSVVAGRDVTEEKRDQEYLRESEERYRSLVETAQIAIFINRQNRIEYANPAAVKLFGASSREEIIGRSPFEFVHPDMHRPMAARIETLLAGGRVPLMETRVVQQSGEERAVDVTAVKFVDRGAPAILVLMQDVTEKKLAEAALRESEEQFRTLADAMPQLCWMANEDGWIFWYNRRWYEYTGSTPEQMQGWGWQSVHDPATLPAVMERWQASIATGAAFDMVFPLRGADGVFRPFLTRVLPVCDRDGKVVRWFGTNTDITEQRNVEEALRQAKEGAEAATRAKSQFLANMSHELRTPMTGVLGMLDLVLFGKLEDEQRELICTAQNSARSLLRILNDILDLTKLESGKLSLEERPFSVRQCVENTFNILLPVARSKGIELSYKVADDVPAMLVGDQTRLCQVLANLAGNAVKFTPQGKVEIAVTVGGSAPGGKELVRFTVDDTGIGIPDAKKHLLFREFSQVDDSHTRSYGGTGLGLAISKEIVDRMEGTIGFTSQEGRGSSFYFAVSLGQVEAAREIPPAPEESAPAVAGANPIAGKPRLLVAEDDPTIREVLGRMLERANFETEIAGNGEEVVEKWERGDYDLILMDIQMPLMNGFEATSAIREKERLRGGHTPIIAMTAHALKEDEKMCLDNGMDAYVSKPIDFKSCIKLIGETLRRNGAAN